jgi:hypothetical protein
VNPFEQRQQRHLEEAWRHGRAAADRQQREHPTWSSECCQAEILEAGRNTFYCKVCGQKQE